MLQYAIGVDLGGTNYRAAAITQDGQQLGKVSGATRSYEGREAVLDSLVEAIQELRGQLKDHRLNGVGIGVPGFIEMSTGTIIGSNNLPELEGFPIQKAIEDRLQTPVILENDANAAALGEKWMGAGQGVDSLVLLTLGTGIGGGIISDGKILHGYKGMAGELGHITVVPNGNPCGCGNRGCLEKHASARAIEAMAVLMGLHEGGSITSQQVFELAQDGNPRAKVIFHCMGEYLGIALATLVNTFNFPLYLLSGGPLPAWDYFAPALFAEVQRRSFTFANAATRIEKATLGNEAGLYGSAYLPFLATVPAN
jgi:glucokinase